MILRPIRNATSLRALPAGLWRCPLLVGHLIVLYGPVAVLANLSASRARALGLMTNATYGQLSAGSSTSADLQQSLASRLRAELAATGSPEYSLTWKQWDMQGGGSIYALRASVRRTSDSDYFGWPTPVSNDDNKSPEAHLAMKQRMGGNRTAITSLQVLAKTFPAGWPTTTASLADKGVRSTMGGLRETMRNHGPDLAAIAATAGYPTPLSLSFKGSHQPGMNASMAKTISFFADGATTGSPAPTEKRGALNPALARWLMGYPPAWCACAVTATR